MTKRNYLVKDLRQIKYYLDKKQKLYSLKLNIPNIFMVFY